MGDYKHLNLLFRQVMLSYGDQNNDFYVKAFSFIEEALKLNDNVDRSRALDLINSKINDDILKESLHNIRKKRNKVLHDVKKCNFSKEEMQNDFDVLNNFIDYCNTKKLINFGNSFRRQFTFTKYESELRNLYPKAFMVDEKRDYFFYGCGYSTRCYSFRIKKVITKSSNDFPTIAVIHNLLIRSKVLKKSSYLNQLDLSQIEYDKIYIYQMLLLNAFRFNSIRMSQTTEIVVNSDDVILLKYALADISRYFHLLMSMQNNTTNLKFSITPKSNLNSVETNDDCQFIIVNDTSIVAEIINEDFDVFNLTKSWLSSSIKYHLDENNLYAYNKILKEIFGYSKFRPGQIDSLYEIFEGNKNIQLTVLPTAYGKSLIYQFYSVIQPTITIVISPTQELVNDQILNLVDINIERVSQFKLDDELNQIFQVHNKPRSNRILAHSTLVYCTSDQINTLETIRFLEFIDYNNWLSAVIIDECHQLSVWGHKFDINYFTITKHLLEHIQNAKFVLLSATASGKVIRDIKHQFLMKNLMLLKPIPLNRGNINYSIKEANSFDDLLKNLKDDLYDSLNLFQNSLAKEDVPFLTIVLNNDIYLLRQIYSRINQQIESNKLCIYQGEHDIFIRFRNANKAVLFTTDDFLTGINIPFLKRIIIVGVPPSKEWLYQETGRVGRSGESSEVYIYNFTTKSTLYESMLDFGYTSDFIIEQINKESPIDLSNVLSSLEIAKRRSFDTKKIDSLFNKMVNKTKVYNKLKRREVQHEVDHRESIQLELPIYIFFMSGIIHKWLKITKQYSYELIFDVDMDIHSDGYTFEQKIVSHISMLSSGTKILDKYSNAIEASSGPLFLLNMLYDWYIENSIEIKRQMLINVSSLLENFSGDNLNATNLEKELSLYFNVNTQDFDNISTTEKRVNFDRQAILEDTNEVVEKAIINMWSIEINSGIKEPYLSETVLAEVIINVAEFSLTNVVNDIPLSIKTEEINSSNSISGSKTVNKKELISDLELFSKNDLNTFDSNQDSEEIFFNYIINLTKNLVSKKELRCIVHTIATSSNENKQYLKAKLDRLTEDKDSLEFAVVLSILEILNPSTKNYYRLKNLFRENINLASLILESINHYINVYKRIEIDSLISSRFGKAYYYKGFFGYIAKKVHLFMNK